MVQIVIKKSSKKDKKFKARIDDRKAVLFGAKAMTILQKGIWTTYVDKVMWQDMEAVIKIGKTMKRLGFGRTIFSGGSLLIEKQ